MSTFTSYKTTNQPLTANIKGSIVNAIYSAITDARRYKLVVAGLLLVVLAGMGNKSFATTYYYPKATVTAGGGGTYCQGATATALTGSIPTGSCTGAFSNSASVTYYW